MDVEDGALPDVLAVLRVTNSPLDHHFAGLVACIAFDDADPTPSRESEQCFAYPMISSSLSLGQGTGPTDSTLGFDASEIAACLPHHTGVLDFCGGLLAPHFKSLR